MMPVDAVAEARRLLAANPTKGPLLVPHQVLGVLAASVALKQAYYAELEASREIEPEQVPAPPHEIEAILSELERLSDRVESFFEKTPMKQEIIAQNVTPHKRPEITRQHVTLLKVIDQWNKSPTVTAAELCRFAGMSAQTAGLRLAALLRCGFIQGERAWGGTSFHWKYLAGWVSDEARRLLSEAEAA